jgi:hypothetical protein
LTEFTKAIENLGGKTRRRLAKGIDDILDAETRRRGLQDFGTCITCRFFREKGDNPHHCMHFEAHLSEPETKLICVAHLAR